MDNCSTDNSVDNINDLYESRPGLRVICQKDCGVYDAMNRGVEIAKGRYIYFLGAGDTLCEGALDSIIRMLPPHDYGFLYGNVRWGQSEYDGPFTPLKLIEKNICHQSIFYGRKVFDILGGYNLAYSVLADYELNLRCMGSSKVKKQYVPILVANYEGGGLSDRVNDRVFGADKKKLVRKHLGFTISARFSFRNSWNKVMNDYPSVSQHLPSWMHSSRH